MTQVHLYRLAQVPEIQPWPGRWMLSREDQARCNRWLNPARRRAFQWGRALMRYVMNQQRVPVRELCFAAGGKPFLDGEGDISLSHGAGQVMVGYSPSGWLGVDVEAHATRETALMERFFLEHERAWMGDDTARLHQLWTVKESALKALGTGVSGNPARVWVDPVAQSVTVMDAPVPEACESWWMEGDGWSAAAVHIRPNAAPDRAEWVQHQVTASDVLGWMTAMSREQPSAGA